MSNKLPKTVSKTLTLIMCSPSIQGEEPTFVVLNGDIASNTDNFIGSPILDVEVEFKIPEGLGTVEQIQIDSLGAKISLEKARSFGAISRYKQQIQDLKALPSL